MLFPIINQSAMHEYKHVESICNHNSLYLKNNIFTLIIHSKVILQSNNQLKNWFCLPKMAQLNIWGYEIYPTYSNLNRPALRARRTKAPIGSATYTEALERKRKTRTESITVSLSHIYNYRKIYLIFSVKLKNQIIYY